MPGKWGYYKGEFAWRQGAEFFVIIHERLKPSVASALRTAPSSRGLGRQVFILVTGVRIPVGSPETGELE